MARLRFPGRPGFRFDRLGVKYGVDEPNKGLDPTTRLIANIHRGLRYFRELFGDSDEEEEFEGFTCKDVADARKRLEQLRAQTQQWEDKKFEPTTTVTVQEPQEGKLRKRKQTKPEQIFEALLATETVQKMHVKSGGKPSKIAARAAAAAAARLGRAKSLTNLSIQMSLAGFQGKVVTKETEEMGKKKREKEQKQREKELKIKKREALRLQKLKEKLKLKKKKIREMEKKKKVVGVKKMDHAVAKQLLTKARKLGCPRKKKAKAIADSRGTEDVPLTSPTQSFMSPKERNNSPVPRVFVLPAMSSRSSRKIKPTKRFYEEEFPASAIVRKFKSPLPADGNVGGVKWGGVEEAGGGQNAQSTARSAPVHMELPAVVPEGSGITQMEYEKMSPETKRFKLFEAPLVVEGKRNRRPSMKLIRTLTDEEDLYLQAEGSQIADRKESGSSGRGRNSTEAMKRSGQNILRKAKLQLNRAALNRSKADLARSLQEQMSPDYDVSNVHMSSQGTHPEFGTSPLKSSPFSKPSTCGPAIGGAALFPRPLVAPSGGQLTDPFSSATSSGVFGKSSLFSSVSAVDQQPSAPARKEVAKGEVSHQCHVCGYLELKKDKVKHLLLRLVCQPCYRFFMRRVNDQIVNHKVFQCDVNGKCSISYDSRNNCISCRYRRCCQVMSIPSAALEKEFLRRDFVDDQRAVSMGVLLHQWQEATSNLPAKLSYESLEVGCEKVVRKTTSKSPSRKHRASDLEESSTTSDELSPRRTPSSLGRLKRTKLKSKLKKKSLEGKSHDEASSSGIVSDSDGTHSVPFGVEGVPAQYMEGMGSSSPAVLAGVMDTLPEVQTVVAGGTAPGDGGRLLEAEDLSQIEEFGDVSDALINDILKSSDPDLSHIQDIAMDTSEVDPLMSLSSPLHITTSSSASIFVKQPVVSLETLSPEQLKRTLKSQELEQSRRESFIDVLENLTGSSPSASVPGTSRDSSSINLAPSISPDSPESGSGARTRGPRIKHVCRKAAVALGRATFPQSELRLSALPQVEKEYILEEDEQKRPGTPDSDDLSMEEIIRRARNEDVLTLKPSSNKGIKALVPRHKKMHGGPPVPFHPKAAKSYKRKMPCRNCERCLRPDCGICLPCKDKTKFGGTGRMKQICAERKCLNPVQPGVCGVPPQVVTQVKIYESRQPRSGVSSIYSRVRKKHHKHLSRMGLDPDDDFDIMKPPMRRHPLVGHVTSYNSAPSRLVTKFDIKKRLKFTEKEMKKLKKENGVLFTSPTPLPGKRYKWPSGTNVNHFIQATFEEDYGLDVAWQNGMALISSNPMCIRTVCYLCGSAGRHELLYCNVCCEPFHSFCLADEDRPSKENLENWCCRRCQFCHVCGKQENAYARQLSKFVAGNSFRLLRCDKCQDTYHPECLGPNYPTKPSQNKKIWICTKCVKCRSCGATTPGAGKNAVWMNDFSLCYECGQLMAKGNYCPVCQKTYYDDDWDSKMIQCSSCDSWVHSKCEGITDERYQLLSFLPEDVLFHCRVCYPQRPAPWDSVIDQEMKAGFSLIVSTLAQSKSACSLDAIDESPERNSQKVKMPIKSILSKGKRTDAPSSQVALYPTRLSTTDAPSSQMALYPTMHSTSACPETTPVRVPFHTSDETICDALSPPSSGPSETVSSSADEERRAEDSTDTPLCSSEQSRNQNDTPTVSPSVEEGNQPKDPGKQSVTSSEEEKQCSQSPSGGELETESYQVASSLLHEILENVFASIGLSSQALRDVSAASQLNAGRVQPLDRPDASGDGVPGDSNENRVPDMHGDDRVPVELCDIDCETGESINEDSSPVSMETSDTDTHQGDTMTTSTTNQSSDTAAVETMACDNSVCDSQSGESLQTEAPSEHQSEFMSQQTEQLMPSGSVHSDESLPLNVSDLEPISVDTSQHHVTFDLREFHDFPRVTPPSSSNSPSATLTADEIPGDSQSDLSDVESSGSAKVKFCLGSASPVKFKKKPKYFPVDLRAVLAKVNRNEYMTVDHFCDDLVRIIQYNVALGDSVGISSRKAHSVIRSLFIKQMSHCFPWFDVKLSRLWENNKNFPKDMLPEAVLPPNDDHTYAQWLAREKTPSSPSPSPFKKPNATPIRTPIANLALGEEQEADPEPEDTRRCLFCSRLGDDVVEDAGRLLYAGQDDWVHVNCTLWSAEVYEEMDGTLQNVNAALARARKLRCDRCHRIGATVGCCNMVCNRNYHYMCARMDDCVFQQDKKVFCRTHRQCVDGKLVTKENFSVFRRMCVEKDLHGKNLKKSWSRGLPPDVVNIVTGSMTVESLGRLSQLSDRKGALYPLDYCITRVYWSTVDPGRRCVYTCRIIEVRPDEQHNLEVCDMTIVHDVRHPSYDPKLERQFRLRRMSAGSGMDMTDSEMDASVATDTMDVDGTYGSADESVIDGGYGMAMPSMGAELLQMLDMGSTADGPAPHRSEDPPQQRTPASSQSSRGSSRSSSIDLAVLNPRTREMLGSVNLDHLDEPRGDNDLNLSTQLVDRLNKAASKSRKTSTNYDLGNSRISDGISGSSQEVSMETDELNHVIGQDSAEMFTVVMDESSRGLGNFPTIEEQPRGHAKMTSTECRSAQMQISEAQNPESLEADAITDAAAAVTMGTASSSSQAHFMETTLTVLGQTVADAPHSVTANNKSSHGGTGHGSSLAQNEVACLTADQPAVSKPQVADPMKPLSASTVTADILAQMSSSSSVTAEASSSPVSTSSVSPTVSLTRTSPTNSISPEPGQKLVTLPDGRICVPVYGKDGQQIGLRTAHRQPKNIPKLKGSDFCRGKIVRHDSMKLHDRKNSLPGQLDGVDDRIEGGAEDQSSSDESGIDEEVDEVEKSDVYENLAARQEGSGLDTRSSSPDWDEADLPCQLDGVDDVSVRRTRSTRTQELDLRGKIDQQIKAQSLARSNTAREGPFKCPSCKRLYRTKESLKLHIGGCNFVVSSDEEDEEEDSEEGDVSKPTLLKTYPLRSGRSGQDIAAEQRKTRGSPQMTAERRLSQKLRGVDDGTVVAKANHVTDSPNENNLNHDESIQTEPLAPVRKRGRPRKSVISESISSPSSTKIVAASSELTDEQPIEEGPKLTRSRARSESISFAKTNDEVAPEEPKLTRSRVRAESIMIEDSKDETVEDEPKLMRTRARAESNSLDGTSDETSQEAAKFTRGRARVGSISLEDASEELSPARVLRRGRPGALSPAPQTLQEIAVAHKSPDVFMTPGAIDKTQGSRKRGRPRKNVDPDSCPVKTIVLEKPSSPNSGDEPAVKPSASPIVNGGMESDLSMSALTDVHNQSDVPEKMEGESLMEEADTEAAENDGDGTDPTEAELNLTLEESPVKDERVQLAEVTSDENQGDDSISISHEEPIPIDAIENAQPQGTESCPESQVKSLPEDATSDPQHQESTLEHCVASPGTGAVGNVEIRETDDKKLSSDPKEPDTIHEVMAVSTAESPAKSESDMEVTESTAKTSSVNPEKTSVSPTEVEVITIDDDDDEDVESPKNAVHTVLNVRVKTSTSGGDSGGNQLPAIIRRPRSAQDLLSDTRVVRFEVTDPAQKAKFSKMNYEMVKLASGKTVKMVRMSAKELASNKALDDMPKFREALKAAVMTSSTSKSKQKTPLSGTESSTQSSPALLQPASEVLKNIQRSMAAQEVTTSLPVATTVETAVTSVVHPQSITPIFAEAKSPPLPTRTVQFVHPPTKPVVLRALAQPRILPKFPLSAERTPLQPPLIPAQPQASYIPAQMPVISPGQQVIAGGLQALLQPQSSTPLVQPAQGSPTLLQGPQGSPALIQGLPVQTGYVIPTGRQAIPQSSMMSPLLPNQTMVSMAPSPPTVIPMAPANQQPVFIQDPSSLAPNLICSPTGLVSMQPPPCVAPPPIRTSPTVHLQDVTPSRPSSLQSPISYINLGDAQRSIHAGTGVSQTLVTSSESRVFQQNTNLVTGRVNKMDGRANMLPRPADAQKTWALSCMNPVMTVSSVQPAVPRSSTQRPYIKSITPVITGDMPFSTSSVVSRPDQLTQAVASITHQPLNSYRSVSSVAVASSHVTPAIQSSVSTLSGLAFPSGAPITSVQFRAIPSVVTTPSILPLSSSQSSLPINTPQAAEQSRQDMVPCTTSPSSSSSSTTRTKAQHMSTSIVLAALSRLLREGVIRDPTVAAQLNVLINQYNKTQSLNHKQQEVLDKIEAILKAHLGGLAAKQVTRQVKAATTTMSQLPGPAVQPLATSSYHSLSNQFGTPATHQEAASHAVASCSLVGQASVGLTRPPPTPVVATESLYFNANTCKRKRADQDNSLSQKRRLLVADGNNMGNTNDRSKPKLLPYAVKGPQQAGFIIRRVKPEKTTARYKKLLKQTLKKKTPRKNLSPLLPKGKRPESLAYSVRTGSLDLENQAPPTDSEWMPYAGRQHEKDTLKVKLLRQDEELPGALHSHNQMHQHIAPHLPQPAQEEEVEDSPLTPQDEKDPVGSPKTAKNSPYLVFEITSDDGFYTRADSWQDAWKSVTDKVQDARQNARLKQLSYNGVSGLTMLGLTNNAIVYLLEQLFAANNCRTYKFKYFKYDQTDLEEEPEENPHGCARAEPFLTRKPHDSFSFLLSKYRTVPLFDLRESLDVDIVHKSQRRATSMDLPMAMRFRHLKSNAREAVGVYRSGIHGRGLFCKRDIDSGEMIIEYAGEIIRSALTDKREHYYESKGIGCYMFRIDDFDVVDATVHGNAGRFINHSCDPNCYSKVINIEGKKHIVIFALRPIKRGEELTYDYKFPIEEVKIPCTCSARRCRKYLN